LAHVATVSFLAARAAPSGAFWLALAGGAALARQAELRGKRAGYASSAAAMLQTVAIIGPLRFSAPLTQALSAPLLGAMHGRGRRWASLFAVCLAIRLVLYATLTAFTLFVLLGPEGYKGSYEALSGWLRFLPRGLAGALLVTAVGNLALAIFFSTLQVGFYRRALDGWPTGALEEAPPRPAPRPQARERAGVDARAALAAAAAVTAVLLVSHDWVVLAAAAAWLAAAAMFARHGDREVLRIGLLLTALLAAGTLVASLLGGLGAEQAASRSVRGALLVLVATWLRLAAGSAGLREAFRRGLLRLRRVPGGHEAGEILGELDSGRLLAGSAPTRSWPGRRRRRARSQRTTRHPLPACASGSATRHLPPRCSSPPARWRRSWEAERRQAPPTATVTGVAYRLARCLRHWTLPAKARL
jgi:hypothetical protein